MVILPVNDTSIRQAAQHIQSGKVVAIPTETVYGLAADAQSSQAIQKIFDIKKRPQDNPLIVHCAHKKEIATHGEIRYDLEQKIIEKYMPGPLTIILPHRHTLAPQIYAGHTTVALRIPDHHSTLQLIRQSKTALAAPSANTSGRPSPTSASMVERDIGDQIDIILDGNMSTIGIESTIVQVLDENKIRILRPGYIDAQILSDELQVQVEHAQSASEHAPGNRYTHYSPQAQVHIVSDLSLSYIQSLIDQGHAV